MSAKNNFSRMIKALMYIVSVKKTKKTYYNIYAWKLERETLGLIKCASKVHLENGFSKS